MSAQCAHIYGYFGKIYILACSTSQINCYCTGLFSHLCIFSVFSVFSVILGILGIPLKKKNDSAAMY